MGKMHVAQGLGIEGKMLFVWVKDDVKPSTVPESEYVSDLVLFQRHRWHRRTSDVDLPLVNLCKSMIRPCPGLLCHPQKPRSWSWYAIGSAVEQLCLEGPFARH